MRCLTPRGISGRLIKWAGWRARLASQEITVGQVAEKLVESVQVDSRVVWTPQLRQQLTDAVETLGVALSTPERVVTVMGVKGLHIENVVGVVEQWQRDAPSQTTKMATVTKANSENEGSDIIRELEQRGLLPKDFRARMPSDDKGDVVDHNDSVELDLRDDSTDDSDYSEEDEMPLIERLKRFQYDM